MKNSLTDRFLNKQLSREELKQLNDDVNQNEDFVLKSIEDDWNSFTPSEKIPWPEQHWQAIESEISPLEIEKQEGNVFRLQWWLKVAAMLFIIASVWFVFRSPENIPTTDNGSPALITEVNNSEEPAIFMLKDGTKVTLTAHSSLSFYENYNSKYRVVHLEGEGYFETDEANNRPFVVISDNITSICRGKEFSIAAYKDSDEINVTLASGQIEIAQNDRLNSENNKVAVKSCERYSFNKTNQEYLIGQISDCEYSDKARSMRESVSSDIVML